MLYGKPIQTPISEPRRILEIGCGTGNMTRYLATVYPSAKEIIGIDLSPIPDRETPRQVTFLQGEFRALVASSEHPELASHSFDYLFSRMLVYGMTDWPGYIAQARDLLASGGWLELQEIHTVYYDENENLFSGSWGWLKEQSDAWAERGLDIHCGPKLEGHLRDAGFEDIHVKQFRWMFGPRKGHPETDLIASYSSQYLFNANFGAFKKVVGPKKTPEELSTIENQMREDMSYSEDGKHCRFFVVYGRKP